MSPAGVRCYASGRKPQLPLVLGQRRRGNVTVGGDYPAPADSLIYDRPRPGATTTSGRRGALRDGGSRRSSRVPAAQV
jgi:hypothetical protein